MKNVALIPAYNEEESILEVVERTKKTKKFYKIIVVDDGSRDNTAKIAKKAGAVVIRHERNKGKGAAIENGFEYIRKIPQVNNIIIIDADLQYNPEESDKLIKSLKTSDFVMGCRNWKLVPFRHRLGNFVWRKSFNIFFGTNLKDTNCGFIGLSRKAFEKIDLSGGGYIIENHMLIEALKKRLKIRQVQVDVTYKEKSAIKRGVRIVLGLLFFIILEGIKYRLKL